MAKHTVHLTLLFEKREKVALPYLYIPVLLHKELKGSELLSNWRQQHEPLIVAKVAFQRVFAKSSGNLLKNKP